MIQKSSILIECYLIFTYKQFFKDIKRIEMLSSNPNSVIIIGAGLAGLTTAEQILKESPQAKVTILEAMSQPGGRTRSVKVQGAIFDLGAQWIGEPQKYVIELAKRAKSELIEQHHEGTKFLEFGEQIQQYKTNIPKDIGYMQLIHLQMMMWKIDRLAKTVPLQNPRKCPHAIEWDSMTAHTWIQQNVWFEKVKRLFQLSIRGILGCETNEVSFLFFLWYVHHNHGLDALINVQNGLQSSKILKGTQSMSFYLEKQIKSRGGKIHYNTFVDSVVQNENGVIVKARNGQEYKAEYLVIAAPPTATKKMTFEPPLSRARRFIADRYTMGAYSKMIILYQKQYWREKGFSGEILSDCHNHPVIMAYDDVRPKENGETQPAIVVFFAASVDEQWTTNSQICKKAVVQKLASYYKCAQMLNPIAIEMKVWNDEESLGGAPTAYTPPGVLTKISNLREPEGRIHWAGTETALVSQGYMDGAIESGIRVSKEVLQRFRKEETVAKQPMPTSKWYSQISTFKRRSWLSKFLWW